MGILKFDKLDGLRLVYDKYKHLDSLFKKSEPFYETRDPANPLLIAACDMWEAIKAVVGKEERDKEIDKCSKEYK